MVNTDLLSLLEDVLGKGKRTSNNNYAFFSPFIQHYKQKLEIDLTLNTDGKNKWHCWVSNERGTSIYSLFKKIKADRDHVSRLSKILDKKYIYAFNTSNDPNHIEPLSLPAEFIPLMQVSSLKDISSRIQLKQAISYLKERGITSTDVLRYNIGYCASGLYGGRIIVPSYNQYFKLNFFISRTIFEDVPYKYKSPAIDRNVIIFESMINWDEPITLVEGVFDAISARYNAIPLLGKTLLPELKEKLIHNKPPKVIVALDNDAYNESLSICHFLISNGILTTLVKLKEKDISEIGFDRYTEYAANSGSMDSYDLLREKILQV